MVPRWWTGPRRWAARERLAEEGIFRWHGGWEAASSARRMNRFQKLAAAALISVIVLIFVGAIVRVSGAGLGCPDWPRCWGRLIPPWKVEQVDLSRIDFEKFQRKAERLGRDPATVTPEHILESFNPRHTWTEFINRLSTSPVVLFSLATFIASFGQRRRRPGIWWCSLAAVVLVGVNAFLGAMVVYSGLKPGVLTVHMALAMLLIAILAYVTWRGTDRPWTLEIPEASRRGVQVAVLAALGLIVAEGILGSQIREMTDALAKSHHEAPREEWIDELEAAPVYLIHRSFSWLIVAATLVAWNLTRRAAGGRVGWPGHLVLALVMAQMVLGLIMAQVRIDAVVQVLHVGLAGVMVAGGVLWWGVTRRAAGS